VIIFLTFIAAGRKHDKKISDEAGYVLPKGSSLLQYTGFQGFSVDDVLILELTQKPSGLQVT
jgi:hypothetical protein